MAYVARAPGAENQRTTDGDESPGLPLTHMRFLGRRVVLQTWIGFFVAGALIIGALIGRHVAGIEDLDTTALILMGVVVAIYKTAGGLIARGHAEPDQPPEVQQRLLRVMYATIILDYLVLTIALWFVGGTRCPFLPFYLLHVILSCILLSRKAAVTFHWLAYGLLASFVIGEWTGLLVPRLPSGAISSTGPLDGRHALTVLVVYFLLFGLTLVLLRGLVRTAREGERRLRTANAELERVSRMRKDFLRIALHNLQSPVGVVTMFLGNLKAGLGGTMTDKQAEMIDRSLGRLSGVKEFMRDLQVLSTLESGRIEAQAVEVDVGELLGGLVKEYEDLAQQGGNSLELDVPEGLPPIRGIPLLLHEAFANYITNAVKYTPEGGVIKVRARTDVPNIHIEVEDQGIGIAEEDQERLFGEFYRVQRKDGATKKIKGTGLGLNIVRAVIEAHGGTVGVRSRMNEGSVFYADLPAA
ncbi:MAG: HAMP domain-containing sensor histidine kinase [Planctomycetota bacterium]|nr:HAMP domain-containing sensor histidine kinase [Planctomycetota bacterium]